MSEEVTGLLTLFQSGDFILRDASLRDAPQDEVLDPHGEEPASPRVSNHEAIGECAFSLS
jgi:hypothetical protein